MSRNGSGTYALPSPPSPFVGGTTIVSADVNSVLTDIANALTGSVAADGQTPMTGALNLGTHAIIGVTTLTASSVVTGGGVVSTGAFTAPNNTAYQGKDTGGTARSMMFMDSSNHTSMVVGTGGKWRVLSTGLTERFAVSDAGIVTSGFSNATGYSLTQTGVSAGVGMAITLSNTSSAFLSFLSGASNVGSVTTNGTTTSYNQTSDYRLKTTYGPASGADILSIPVYDAEWKSLPGQRQPMCFAHEVAEVAPWAVIGDKDAVDGNGNVVSQQVDYSKLVPALIAAVQDLAAQVAALKASL